MIMNWNGSEWWPIAIGNPNTKELAWRGEGGGDLRGASFLYDI